VYLTNEGKDSPAFKSDKNFKTCQTIPNFIEYPSSSFRTFKLQSDEKTYVTIYATIEDHQTGEKYMMPVSPSSVIIHPDVTEDFMFNYTCDRIVGTHAIVRININDEYNFEYVKQCQDVPKQEIQYLISSGSLLLIAIVVLSIAVRQDQFKFVKESEEGQMYEINSLSIKQVLGVL